MGYYNNYKLPCEEDKEVFEERFNNFALENNLDKSEWKTVTGFHAYKVSKKGEIYSGLINKIMKPTKDKDGYLKLNLVRYDKDFKAKKDVRVHNVVLSTFKPKPEDSKADQINHIDFDKANNNLDNLEWVTCKENIAHTRNTGRHPGTAGSRNSNAKVTEQDVMEIRKVYDYSKRAELAEKYGISPKTVENIAYRITWKHI